MNQRRLCLAIVLLCLNTGCGDDGPELAPVEGIVTLDGQPVEAAGVMFMPDDGPAASGATDAQGHFRLMTNQRDGAVLGHHRVTVAKSTHEGSIESEDGLSGRVSPDGYGEVFVIPEKYRNPTTSRLTVTVAADNEPFSFDLSSDDLPTDP